MQRFPKTPQKMVKTEKVRVRPEEGRGGWVDPATRSVFCVLAKGDHLEASLREKHSFSACDGHGYQLALPRLFPGEAPGKLSQPRSHSSFKPRPRLTNTLLVCLGVCLFAGFGSVFFFN